MWQIVLKMCCKIAYKRYKATLTESQRNKLCNNYRRLRGDCGKGMCDKMADTEGFDIAKMGVLTTCYKTILKIWKIELCDKMWWKSVNKENRI